MFEEKLKQALTGKVFNSFGLKEDPFTIKPKDIIESFVNREREMNQFIRVFANLKEKNISTISIVGARGDGKTHFLRYIKELFEKNLKLIGFEKVVFIKGEMYFKLFFIQDEEVKLNQEISKENTLIIFDDLDSIAQYYPKEVSIIFELLEGRFISSWNKSNWDEITSSNKIKFPKLEVIELRPFNFTDCIDILKKRIFESKLNEEVNKIFPDYIIEMLSKLSNGNPNRLMEYAKLYLNFIIDNNIFEANSKTFKEFTKEIGADFLENVKEEVENLTIKQKIILKIILDNNEISSTHLALLLGISRIGALQHLNILLHKKLLRKKLKLNKKVYYIPSELIDEVKLLI